MVKEEGRTEEEKQAIGRMKMLEEIAKEIFKGKKVDRGSNWILVNNEIWAYAKYKEVHIKDQKHEVDAYNLALAYETYDGEDWNLKKDYDEPDSKEETSNN